MLPKVETLIVTLCSADRRASILRAIESARTQEGAEVRPVLVINGNRFDPVFRAELARRSDIDVHYLPEGNLFLARKYAREAVTAEFFCWLDDDDIYFPGAIERRLRPLLDDPHLDACISNGVFRAGEEEERLFESANAIGRDPVGCLLERNWLAAAGGLYRTSAISTDYFDASVRSLDMTYLALRLALEKNLCFLGEPTFRKNRTPGSISASVGWMLPAKDVLRAMMELPLGDRDRRVLRRKIGAAHHDLSDHFRHAGDSGRAWRNHLASLATPGGVRRYGAYTRRLFATRSVRPTDKTVQ